MYNKYSTERELSLGVASVSNRHSNLTLAVRLFFCPSFHHFYQAVAISLGAIKYQQIRTKTYTMCL